MSGTLAAPDIYPRDGFVATYGRGPITVRVTSATAGAIVRYTDDGTEPTGNSDVFPAIGRTYSQFVRPLVIKAKAFKRDPSTFRDLASGTAVARYSIKIGPPRFDPLPSSQTIVLPADGLSITVQPDKLFPEAPVLLAVTTDGSDPRRDLAESSDGRNLLLIHNTTVKARCFAQDCIDSDTIVKAYTFKCSTPTINDRISSAAPITFQRSQNVSINCATEGATIHYTLDNSDPQYSPARRVYSSPFALTNTTMVKARAIKANLNISDLANIFFQRV